MTKPKRLSSRGCVLAAMWVVAGDFATAEQVAPAGAEATSPSATPISFRIEAQPMDRALKEFASQADLQLVYETGDVDSTTRTNGLVGSFTPAAALSRLLAHTSLGYRFVNGRTVSIRTSAFVAKPDRYRADEIRREEDSTGPGGGAVPETRNSSGSPLPNPEAEEGKKTGAARKNDLDEVTVTGSRLEGSKHSQQYIESYNRDAIDQSGKSTVSNFLNTIPSVSLVVDPGSLQTTSTVTSVRLHGLPLGTTLVLVDGRRVENSAVAASNNVFDLNNIPLAAVERIEVVPAGSSAVYGSDAIAGVVNIITRKNIQGFIFDSKYGGDVGSRDWDGSLGWGTRWDRGSFSTIASYSDQGQLIGSDRPLTANADFTRFGGFDERFDFSNPGNVFSVDGSDLPGVGAPYAAVPKGLIGPPTQAEFAKTAGQLNKYSIYSQWGLVPASRRAGVSSYLDYELTDSVDIFAQLLYQHIRTDQALYLQYLYAAPGYQQYTVSAANPFNPFGQTVGIGYAFPNSVSDTIVTNFAQPVIGIRGSISSRWRWEVDAWISDEETNRTMTNQVDGVALQSALNSPDPAAAFNPFIAGNGISTGLIGTLLHDDLQTYRARTAAATAVVRGPLFNLPQGTIDSAFGTEFNKNTLESSDTNGQSPLALASASVARSVTAAFGELRIPIIRARAGANEPRLAVTAAGRYDHYSDFGGKTTPQVSIKWHPTESLVVRGSWGRAFKAPSLFEARSVRTTSSTAVVDPLTGLTEGVTATSGGNPNLKPETGLSRTFGFEYTATDFLGLHLSVDHWAIDEHNNIQVLSAQEVVDFSALFPGAVTRAAFCAGGPPCPIIAVDQSLTNFGDLQLAGIDYDASFAVHVGNAQLVPAINAVETYKYKGALQPGAPLTDRVSQSNDDTNWAPRWKGTVSLSWRAPQYSATVSGRYTSSYKDSDPLPTGKYLTLGNLWYVDLNARLYLSRIIQFVSVMRELSESYVEIGGANVLNRLPQFSMYSGGFYGFDITQADVNGRELYVRVGASW